jgi:biotin carboxyl carrier protein
MKMENDIPAPKTGTVASVTANEGQSVEEGTVIAMIN